MNNIRFIKDRLDRIHMTLRTRNNILSAQDYYPYGGILRSYVQDASNDKYKFTGKERDKESGLDYWLTPGARYYDSEVGSLSLRGWLSVDPMASKYKVYPPYGGAGAHTIIV